MLSFLVKSAFGINLGHWKVAILANSGKWNKISWFKKFPKSKIDSKAVRSEKCVNKNSPTKIESVVGVNNIQMNL